MPETVEKSIEKPESHKVLIVRVPEPRVHTNADSLELLDILGYQVVVKKGAFKPGELAVYIQPDSVVPQTEPFKWLWEAYVGLDGTVPTKRRRVTVRAFRKEYSEGLLMPVTDFSGGLVHEPKLAYGWLEEGQDVSDLLGVTHYEPEEGTTGTSAAAPKRKKRYPNSLLGWVRYFYYNTLRIFSGGRLYSRSQAIDVSFDAPAYDVTAQKAARSGFQYDEKVVVTEKLHGSNARYVYLDGVMYAGSHFQWKAPDSPCIFTRVLKQYPWIEEWCRSNEGRVLYGEVIGNQGGYTYGLDKTKGELDFRAFDIWEPDGTWTKPWKDAALSTEAGYGANSYNGIRTVPILWSGTADILKIKELTDGKSAIDGKTQREGVVISETAPARVGYRRPRQLKRVSNLFLEKDSK